VFQSRIPFGMMALVLVVDSFEPVFVFLIGVTATLFFRASSTNPSRAGALSTKSPAWW
jgi:hypothetical protein